VTWRSKTIAAVGVVAVVAGAVGARYVAARHRDEQIRREMHEKARTLKDEIDRRFPVGTPRADFMTFADKQPGWHARSGDDYYISIGQEPSRVWYCGPWEVGVVAKFNADRLASTSIGSWGLNCL
jgi:hypothetical protein